MTNAGNYSSKLFISMLLTVVMLLLAARPTSVSAQAAELAEIPWQDWTITPFEQAKQQNRMILVNVGMEGCAACARMEHITYADPVVASLIALEDKESGGFYASSMDETAAIIAPRNFEGQAVDNFKRSTK